MNDQRCGFGSIWWVDDAVWARELPEFRWRKKPGDSRHPGVSIKRVSQVGPQLSPVTMLFGTSQYQGPLVFLGLSAKNPTAPTYFGRIASPATISHDDRQQRLVNPNHAKKELEPTEKKDLHCWCTQKGL